LGFLFVYMDARVSDPVRLELVTAQKGFPELAARLQWVMEDASRNQREPLAGFFRGLLKRFSTPVILLRAMFEFILGKGSSYRLKYLLLI